MSHDQENHTHLLEGDLHCFFLSIDMPLEGSHSQSCKTL